MMKVSIIFILIVAFVILGCAVKQKVNFIVHKCNKNQFQTTTFRNIRLFKGTAHVTYGDGKFVTFLNEGDNNLELEEGYYYVECTKNVSNNNGIRNPGDQESYKFFDVQGTISEYDLCNVYNRGDWRIK